VPYLIYDPASPGPGGVYTEKAVAGSPGADAHPHKSWVKKREPPKY
jgi:hypothetical protein